MRRSGSYENELLPPSPPKTMMMTTTTTAPSGVEDESSLLLPAASNVRSSLDEPVVAITRLTSFRAAVLLILATVLSGLAFYCYGEITERHLLRRWHAGSSSSSATGSSYETPAPFGSDFVWGVATSAYQIEGAVHEDGRGETIWDRFVRVVPTADNSTGAMADDHYHQWKDDVALMKHLNVQAYRFSLSWARILPYGRISSSSTSTSSNGADTGVNEAGLRFYDDLIDELLRNGIEPWITLFHWDLPQALQDDYGGWMSAHTVTAFTEYARIVFDRYSHKVNRFITINEPWTFAVNGHGTGIHAPGRSLYGDTEPYIVAHNLILAHAKVARLYKAHYAGKDGMIGISNCGDFRYPLHNRSSNDQEAAERAMLFQWGWFVEPLIFGRYPIVMRERLGHRLPRFSESEVRMLHKSTDFLGLNYYSSLLATKPQRRDPHDGYWADIHVDFSDHPDWRKNDMGWNVVPDGLKDMLLWISERYNSPLVYITENGSAEAELTAETALHDKERKSYFRDHIRACGEALQLGHVKLAGYFAWSLMDNFEWQFGYTRRFGLYRVDFETLERTPRDSALWYRDAIRSNGKNSFVNRREPYRALTQNTVSSKQFRSIPEKVLIGYGNECDTVRQAIYDGVNIVIWSFVDVAVENDVVDFHRRLDATSGRGTSDAFRQPFVTTNLNLTAVRSFVTELRRSGFAHVLHLASVGGWNGAHLNSQISAVEWYQTFNTSLGDFFDGIDWDLEGNDQMQSGANFFTLECLDKMGAISHLAKLDGRFISMAPPQSYLDKGNERFSRYVNLTDDSSDRDGWHSDFALFGSNVYAYLLFRYGDVVDLVSIQFYESYSRAGKAIYYDGMPASQYLVDFVQSLCFGNESFHVDFTGDPALGVLGRQQISLPRRKLVLGLGNGWAGGVDQKALYIPPHELEQVWSALHTVQLSPRGFMFWSITDEGTNGVFLARELHRILQETTGYR